MTGLGIAGFGGTAGRSQAAQWTANEGANAKVVDDFCAAFAGKDLDKLMSFFAENGAYRVVETAEPAKGLPAVRRQIGDFLNQVVRFDVLETFAKGPIVINERKDYFGGSPGGQWHGVGVFFLKSGKIVEWYDYTIANGSG